MDNKKLSARTKNLILNGFKMAGTNEYAYLYIEEQLLVSEAKTVEKFIKWCINCGKGVGPANIDKHWNDFVSGVKAPKNYFEVVSSFDLGFYPGTKTRWFSESRKRIPEEHKEDIIHICARCIHSNIDAVTSIAVVSNDGTYNKNYDKFEIYKIKDSAKYSNKIHKIRRENEIF